MESHYGGTNLMIDQLRTIYNRSIRDPARSVPAAVFSRAVVLCRTYILINTLDLLEPEPVAISAAR